jgi:hypothetical protein
MKLILILFILSILSISSIHSHTINCQADASTPNHKFITTSETITPERRIVVFRNCESRFECNLCLNSNCGVCDVVEDTLDFHKIYLPSNNNSYLVVILTTSNNSEVYCYLNHLDNSTYYTNYELDINSCSISSCPQYADCSSCTNVGCSYCTTYGCVAGTPSDTGCVNGGCCSLHTDCNTCSLDSDCQWCNSKKCYNNTITCDRSESLTCNLATTYSLNNMSNSIIIDRKFALWNGNSYIKKFLSGIDIGVTLPGLSPGELQFVTYDQWFHFLQLSYDLKVDVIRVYTLLPPQFYEAFYNFNKYLGNNNFLYLFQGIWSPLDGADPTSNAWNQLFVDKFRTSITETIAALHGNIVIGFRYGEAYGTYTYDVSRWLGGFILGTEWDPYIVNVTNFYNSNPGITYSHFQPIPEANSFEQWLAYMMDLLAIENLKYNTKIPIAFTNWVTTDDIFHPLEPYTFEDAVSLDPTHIIDVHQIGTFTSIHAYPYYPDNLRFEYTQCKGCMGTFDPFAGYIRELRRHHNMMPLIISEFGLSTSRVSAHNGPLKRNQGGLTEQEQADKLAELLHLLFDEDVDGGFVFSLTDEWFKRCWTSMHLEVPETRQLWSNRLAAEEFFGLVATESNLKMSIDGLINDWMVRPHTMYNNTLFQTHIAHDETGLYINLERHNVNWNVNASGDLLDEIIIGFDVYPGGDRDNLTFYLKKLNGKVLSFSNNSNYGVEFVLQLGAGDYRLYVNNLYDPFIYKYGYDGIWSLPAGTIKNFEDFRMPLSYILDARNFTQCNENFDYLNAGTFTNFDFKVNGRMIEFRIDWNLLGFMDPANHKVWKYPTTAERSSNIKIADRIFNPDVTSQIKFQIQTRISNVKTLNPLVTYNWNTWTESNILWTERLKPSYYSYRDAVLTIKNNTINTCLKRFQNCKNFQKLDCANINPNTYYGVTFPTSVKTIFYPYFENNFFNAGTSNNVMKNHGLPNITYLDSNMIHNSFLMSSNNVKYRVNVYQDQNQIRFNEVILVINGATVLSSNQNFTSKVLHYVDRIMNPPTQTINQYLNTTNTTMSLVLSRLGWNNSLIGNLTSNLTSNLTLFIPTLNNYNMVSNLCNSTIYCQKLLNCHLVSDVVYNVGMFNGITLTNLENKPIITNNLIFGSKDNVMLNGVIHFVNNVINCY